MKVKVSTLYEQRIDVDEAWLFIKQHSVNLILFCSGNRRVLWPRTSTVTCMK